MDRHITWLQGLSRQAKLSIIGIVDFGIFCLALIVAYGLRFSTFEMPPQSVWHLYIIAPLLSVATAYGTGIYWAATRIYSFDTERRILISQAVAMALWVIVLFLAGTGGFPRSIVGIYALLTVGGMVLVRKIIATLMDKEGRARALRPTIPCLVFGAGHQGIQVVEALRRNKSYKVLAFLDTDYTLFDRSVSGLRVYPLENLNYVVDRFEPAEVIIAKADMSRSNLRKLFDMFREHKLSAKIVPNLGELVDGELKLSEVRSIHVEDLLGRDPVPPDAELMDRPTKGLSVMVTGAGGSIGSELVRQVAERGPRRVVLVDNNEFALFEIHREIESDLRNNLLSGFELVPVLADVRDKAVMSAAMKANQVDIVFHAAAYKHVRMVQENIFAGLQNNVFGTIATAEAALQNQVQRFILISTDKAVRPTSIMGASKRVSEQVIQALAEKPRHKTIFSMVRFGNVLGSTGSVVPLFREQIAAGGPITVTHPDVTRYFMLIPEAAQLVIQAGALAEGGEVFVLDMGEPVKIVNLAETMIELAGLTRKTADTPDGDIEIAFIGLKDGEKLYEELELGNDLTPTKHARILKAREGHLSMAQIQKQLDVFLGLHAKGDDHKLAAELMVLAGGLNSESKKPESKTDARALSR